MIARQKCTVYNVVFKLNVINFAEQLNNSVIAHHFTFIEKTSARMEKEKKKKFKFSKNNETAHWCKDIF